MKGNRVQNVVQELRGEKIDIIPWNPDQAKYICSALAPAEVVRVIIDEISRSMEVVVPDDQLSLAIGKRGQNVRLASRLTGWKIDVKSEAMAAEKEDDGHKALTRISGIGPAIAEKLVASGIKSIAMLAATDLEILAAIPGIGEISGQEWIDEAGRLLDEETGSGKKA
jgi:N utilization substance protein A